MDDKIGHELLDELLPFFEGLEAQTAAILQFLKDKGLASDEELEPYLEQAGKASNVRWRAARARLNRLLASADGSSEASTDSGKSAHAEKTNADDAKPAAAKNKTTEANNDERKDASDTEPDPRDRSIQGSTPNAENPPGGKQNTTDQPNQSGEKDAA